MIALKRRGIGVIAVAIGLHNNALGRPEEIHREAFDQDVYLWQRKTRVATERKEVDLGGGARLCSTWIDLPSDPAQTTRTRAQRSPLEQPCQLRPAQPPGPVRGDQRVFELTRIQASCHVEQGPLDGSDRYSGLDRLLRIFKQARLVKPDLCARASAGFTCYLRRTRRTSNRPELCRAAVRQERAGTAGKHRRHPPAPLIDSTVPQGENTLVKRNERSIFEPGLNQALAAAKLGQLSTRDHPMLSFGEIANRPRCLKPGVPRACIKFSSYLMENSMRAGLVGAGNCDADDSGANRRAQDAQNVTSSLRTTRDHLCESATRIPAVTRRRPRPLAHRRGSCGAPGRGA